MGDYYLMHYSSPYYDPEYAHRYYMEHRKLKGYANRYGGLNEKGNIAAAYVKKRIEDERKAKVDKDKQRTDQEIGLNRDLMKRGVRYNNDKMKAQIKSNTDRVNSQIKSNSERMKAEQKSNREAGKREIEQNKAVTQSQINRLRELLKGMSKEQKAQNKEKIQAQIDRLRENNANYRADVQYDIKNQNTRLRDTHKIESTALRSKNKEESAKLRAENKSVNGNLRMHTNQDNMFLREAHQEFRRVAKRQANEKWQNELARIRSDKNFRSVKISKLRR